MKYIVECESEFAGLQIRGRRIPMAEPINLSEDEISYIDACRVKRFESDGSLKSDKPFFSVKPAGRTLDGEAFQK